MSDNKKSEDPQSSKPHIDPKMLGILVCPKTRGPLIYDKAANKLISKKAKLAYPIRDGVPILLESAASPLN